MTTEAKQFHHAIRRGRMERASRPRARRRGQFRRRRGVPRSCRARGAQLADRDPQRPRNGARRSTQDREGEARTIRETQRATARTEQVMPGPKAKPGRDGDAVQARARVNAQVNHGLRPRPNTLSCTDCGHVWREGERRHEYDHHLGYAAEHHYDVEPVCTTCHAARDSAAKAKTHCVHGHEFTKANTILASNGTRHCRACRRRYDNTRGRDAAFWRAYRAKRKATTHG